ncbi:MAG: hypothetical protein WD025_05180 [Bacteriovoracaceae bacterium]
MKKKSIILPILALILCSSCSMLDQRDFHHQMDTRFDDPLFAPSRDFEVVAGDEGRAFIDEKELRGRVPATADQRENARHNQSINKELRYLESRLSDSDYERYLGIRDQLGGNYEKIYYLRLPPLEKAQYLQARNLVPKRHSGVPTPEQSRFQSEIFMNMEKEQVLRSLGEPHRRDYAGDPSSGNERWAYNLNDRVKFIYFEAGQVAGWAEQ